MTASEITKPTTLSVPFCKSDGKALFRVSAGVPVAYALEQASNLLACVEWLVLNSSGKTVETTAVQYLNEMAKAVVDACHPGE